jgi:hypothetical protein
VVSGLGNLKLEMFFDNVVLSIEDWLVSYQVAVPWLLTATQSYLLNILLFYFPFLQMLKDIIFFGENSITIY